MDWIGSAMSAGAVKSKTTGYYVASTGTAKSGNLCKRYMRICSGIDTEMSSCIFSGSSAWTVWDAGETMLQGGEMQGSSWEYIIEAVSSSSSSVGVMQVEDTRRVTQAVFVIVDDS